MKNKSEIIELSKQGMSNVALAKKFECSTQTIRKFLKEYGLRSQRLYYLANANNPENFKKNIIESYSRGESIYSIGHRLNIPLTTLERYMRKWGYSIVSGRHTHRDGLLKDKIEEIIRLYTVEKLGVDAIAKKFGLKGSMNIRRLLINKGLMRGYEETSFDVDLDFFSKIDTPNKAYTLGFIFADGCVEKNLSRWFIALKSSDAEILERIRQEINYTGSLRYNKNRGTSSDKYMLSISKSKMCKDLVTLGCPPQKTWKIRFPEYLSTDLISHFCRGYWCGDGSISKYACECSVVSNKQFLEGLVPHLPCEITNIYLYQSKEFPDDPDKQVGKLLVSRKKEALKLLHWLYGNCFEHLYLKRKYDLAQKYLVGYAP